MSYLAKTPEDLIPCPFCGGEAKAFFCEESGTYDVQCQQCGALPFLGRKRGSGRFKSMDDVIAAWNRRAERTCRMVDCSTHDTCVVNRELGNGNIVSMEFGYKQCSECGAYVFDCPTVRYCPVCGARVIGKETGNAD